jgi:hypothetical protein
VFAADKAIADVYLVPISTSDARDPNTTFKERAAECSTGYNKRSSARPEDAEKQDMDVLFGSNRYNMDQLPYVLDDSSQDHASHVPSRFNIDWLGEVDTPDQVQPSHFDMDQLLRDPPPRFDVDELRTVNPAALNI